MSIKNRNTLKHPKETVFTILPESSSSWYRWVPAGLSPPVSHCYSPLTWLQHGHLTSLVHHYWNIFHHCHDHSSWKTRSKTGSITKVDFKKIYISKWELLSEWVCWAGWEMASEGEKISLWFQQKIINKILIYGLQQNNCFNFNNSNIWFHKFTCS